MKFAVARLAVAAALFVGWVGYLSYLAATTHNPIVLSRPQFNASERNVIATCKGGNQFVIDEVLYPKDLSGEMKGKTLVVANLKDCQTFSPEDGWRSVKADPPIGGQKYLLPLQTAAVAPPAGAEAQEVMDVVRIPASPGYPPLSDEAGPPRIYPADNEVMSQYESIPRPQ